MYNFNYLSRTQMWELTLQKIMFSGLKIARLQMKSSFLRVHIFSHVVVNLNLFLKYTDKFFFVARSLSIFVESSSFIFD